MGTQRAKGQGPGNEEASLCFPGKSPSQVQARDRTGVVRTTALEATSRDGRGRSRLPQGGPSSLWGRGLVSVHSLGKQLRNRILNTQIKK